jgi:6-pyruvoyltetrahydropterin/6-carboxytetrahydropterin synthase
MIITKEIEIDMGHRVPNHKSKCRNLHGHRYKIEVGVDDKVIATPGSSDEGMVIDFSDLKQIMMDEIDAKFDHGFVMYENDEFFNVFNELYGNFDQKIIFVEFIPTAENLAKLWYDLMKPRLAERKIKIHHVKIWETPSSTATYQE